ncbi:MAG: dihydroorotase [Methylotetracoccus sp.]
METLSILRPDDWHVHLRDGPLLARVAADTASRFGRALVMPNLQPPVTSTSEALRYRQRILDAVPGAPGFRPLMALYLTDATPVDEIARIAEQPDILGCKLYPAGATTNSESGVTNLERLDPVLEAMQKLGVPLFVHGEVTDADIDIFDREKAFIDRHLRPLTERFPELRITFEHVTTEDAVQFVRQSHDKVGATITAHHLLYSRNALLAGGIRPHFYCLPVLKRERHRRALLAAATSGEPRFFLGTDSAPHLRSRKEAACGCAGCYTAHAAIELYATAFESVGALDRLEGFASLFGARFYGLTLNREHITLTRQSWQAPEELPADGEDPLIPLAAGEAIAWRVADAI